MVSQEEYEYSVFKCAFCKALNPARKLRPIAPRLPLPSKVHEETGIKQLTHMQSPQPQMESKLSVPVSNKNLGIFNKCSLYSTSFV